MPPRGDIELPPVPGTGDPRAAQIPLAKRPARVRTNAIESKVLAVDVVQGDDSIGDRQFMAGVDGKIGDISHEMLCHIGLAAR